MGELINEILATRMDETDLVVDHVLMDDAGKKSSPAPSRVSLPLLGDESTP